jgi:hypothetical protein
MILITDTAIQRQFKMILSKVRVGADLQKDHTVPCESRYSVVVG